MKKIEYIIKELTKLVGQLDELMVKIISLTGWLIIFLKVLE